MTSAHDDSEEESEEFDRTASMFVDGSPAVGIGGVDIWRSTITPLADEDESPSQPLSWHVTVVPGPSGAQGSVGVLGDLSCRNGAWFLGVTAIMPISYRDESEAPNPDDPEAMNAAGRVLGPWVSNVLYDVVAMRARQLIASSTSCDLELPVMTPRVQVGHFSLLEEEPTDEDS